MRKQKKISKNSFSNLIQQHSKIRKRRRKKSERWYYYLKKLIKDISAQTFIKLEKKKMSTKWIRLIKK